MGVSLETPEASRRRLLVQVLASELNEYEFFAFLDQGNPTANFFLNLLPLSLVQAVYRYLKKTNISLKTRSDSETIQLVLMVAIPFLMNLLIQKVKN